MSEPFAILVVDDNPPMVESLAEVLKVKGFAVYTALCGAEALKVLEAHPVQIMLTDVRMPDMSGVQLYRKTRQNYPRLITILMTAYSADDIIQKGMMEGIKTVLTKPLKMDFLITLLSAYKRQAGQ
jgi:CheY-like chemotaxis protein